MTERPATYNLASLVVRTLPDALPDVKARLSALPGVDVHHEEPASSRLVITFEHSGTFDRERLEDIRRVAGVVSAELVYHYVESDAAGAVGGVPDAGDPY